MIIPPSLVSPAYFCMRCPKQFIFTCALSSFEEDAGKSCFESCCQAVLASPDNAEAHQLKASCLLSQQKPQEAKEALMKGLSLWLPSLLSKRLEHEEGEDSSEEDLGRDIVVRELVRKEWYEVESVITTGRSFSQEML